MSDELIRQIEDRRNDPEFMARLRASIEKHKPLLDRLAASDTTSRPPTGATPIMPFEQLRDTGLLWLINATVFHPRGYAMSISFDDNGNANGWQLLGDGETPWRYHPDLNDEIDTKFQRVRRLMP